MLNLACIVFVFLSVQNSNAFLIDKVAATVNNEVVLLSNIEKFDKTFSLRKELDPLFGFSQDMLSGKVSQKKILDFLVQERLIVQSFKIPDEDVEQEIQNIQNSNSLNREELVSFLKGKGFSFDDYFELMRVGLSKRALLDREIRTRVNITDDDIKNYYYNHFLKGSNAPVDYDIQLIVISKSNYKSSKAAEDTAKEAIKSISQGESFSEVAKRVSDDSSAASGGALGYISITNLSEPLKNAIKKLRTGSVSDLIQTSSGFMIVKLIDFRTPDIKDLKDKRAQIQEVLAKDEYKRQLELWAERAMNNAFVHTNLN